MNQRTREGPQRQGRPANPVLFDPARPEAELYDTLAEQQAEKYKEQEISSSQLRKFFGEVKDLYRRLQQDPERWDREIKPRFKKLRSMAMYLCPPERSKQKIPERFRDFIMACVERVQTKDEFCKFVLHFEALVGFMYGKGKVGR